MHSLILQALSPIVFVIGLGWIAGATGAMPEAAPGILARFVIHFALPTALFLAAAKADPTQLFHPGLLAALAAGLIGVYAVAFVVGGPLFGRRGGAAGLQALGCSFPNMAYCGPPVLLAVVGSSGILAVVVGNLLVTLITVPFTLVLLASTKFGDPSNVRDGVVNAVSHAFKQPLVFLPAAGALLSALHIPMPHLAEPALDEIGRTAAGTALFTLGLILSHAKIAMTREVLFNVAVKNVLQPAVILAAGWAIGLEGPTLKMAFLIGVLPSATEVPNLSIAHGVYAREAASTTFLSTLFSIVSISAGIAIAGGLDR